ncbi:mechanosensitive ion channel domain-containing protein [Crocinitomix algicola]|uniref:mechanosensitive ion channel domain-containing protein n=1 Tax=Crocinitomix algicola TaxID=1740263 RepID=UPI000872073C|nr:mechanosensitive ion channel domain-containing protein [Crocinitomix algicola]
MLSNRLFSLGYGLDTFIILLLIGGVIFGSFYLVRHYIVPVFETGKKNAKIELFLFRLETIIWLLFAFFSITQFLTESLFVTAALLLVVGLIGFNFWRDFFPGLWLRLGNKYKVNDPVRFMNYIGLISKIGTTSIHLKTKDEEIVYIPFHKLTSELFVKRQAKGKLMSKKIVYQIGDIDKEKLLSAVNGWIQECPWSIPQSDYVVNLQSDGFLNITVYAVDEYSLTKTEFYLQNCLESF